jgi:hypothetical protein
MSQFDRRTFHRATLGSLLTFSLLDSLFACDAFGDEIKPVAARWLNSLHELGQDLKGRKLTQIEWQEQVEKLMEQVSLPELLTFINLDKIKQDLKASDRGEKSIHQALPEVEGLPTNLIFGHQIFALKKDRSVAPHGHNNMATAFLMLSGECHGRHYDRLEDGDDFMIIRPTIDDKFGAGTYSTVSDYKDNIHWFKATSESAFIFNIHILNVDANKKENGRVYVDPDGEKLAHGLIKAKRIDHKLAYDKYG